MFHSGKIRCMMVDVQSGCHVVMGYFKSLLALYCVVASVENKGIAIWFLKCFELEHFYALIEFLGGC